MPYNQALAGRVRKMLRGKRAITVKEQFGGIGFTIVSALNLGVPGWLEWLPYWGCRWGDRRLPPHIGDCQNPLDRCKEIVGRVDSFAGAQSCHEVE